MKKGIGLLLFIILFFTVAIAIIGYISLSRSKNTPTVKTDYSIPTKLVYSEQKGWTSIKGPDWTFSTKDSWKLKQIDGETKYLNDKIHVRMYSGKQSSLEELSCFSEKPELNAFNNTAVNLNGESASIIFYETQGNTAGWLTIIVGCKKDKSSMQIVTKHDFYNSNKADIVTMISSFR